MAICMPPVIRESQRTTFGSHFLPNHGIWELNSGHQASAASAGPSYHP